ncbi:hypothetical protein J6590_092122, partial [Homalodisca vitripennis]
RETDVQGGEVGHQNVPGAQEMEGFCNRIQDEHPILEENESGLYLTIRFGQADKATR